MYLQTDAIVRAFQSEEMKSAGVTLDCLEIGNEADYYEGQGRREHGKWSIGDYVIKCVFLVEMLTKR